MRISVSFLVSQSPAPCVAPWVSQAATFWGCGHGGPHSGLERCVLRDHGLEGQASKCPQGRCPAAGGRAGSSGCLPLSSLRTGGVFWTLLERGCVGGGSLSRGHGYWGGQCRRERALSCILPRFACGPASFLCFCEGRWWHLPDGVC